jgi:hypothetical protein
VVVMCGAVEDESSFAQRECRIHTLQSNGDNSRLRNCTHSQVSRQEVGVAAGNQS